MIQTCVDLLEKVERDEVGPGDGMNAAWTLASFQRPEHEDLLQRLSEKPMERLVDCRVSRGSASSCRAARSTRLRRNCGSEPVEEWLPPRCKMVKDWFDKNKEEYDLRRQSEESPEAEQARTLGHRVSPLAGRHGRCRPDCATMRTRLLMACCTIPSRDLTRSRAEWDELTLRQLFLLIMPKELAPADRPLLEKFAPVTEALLYWLGIRGPAGRTPMR